jgi:hypothetical protein
MVWQIGTLVSEECATSIFKCEVFAVLGFYAALVGTCLPMFFDGLLGLSSRVKQPKKAQ